MPAIQEDVGPSLLSGANVNKRSCTESFFFEPSDAPAGAGFHPQHSLSRDQVAVSYVEKSIFHFLGAFFLEFLLVYIYGQELCQFNQSRFFLCNIIKLLD